MGKIFIYSLVCPVGESVKYVGKTKTELSIRLSAHLTDSGENIEKNLWIGSLKEKGLRPEIKLLEVTNDEFWEIKEGQWIEKFTNDGVKLFNKTLDENHKFVILTAYLSTLKRLNYRPQTIKSYRGYFLCYLRDFTGKIYKDIKVAEITSYLSELVENKNISPVHQNSLINAIKFYYEKVLKYPKQTYYISRPRKPSKIRPILSPEQVLKLVDSISNLKQKTAMQIIYSGALRIGEAVKLLVCDFDFNIRTLMIRDAKGGKDRIVTLPEQTMNLVKMYLEEYKCDYWLFEGQNKGECYSPSSIQQVFGRQIKSLGFNLELTPHCLRHSRLSHVLNSGVKIEMASKYAGHKSISTTADIYYHYMTDDMQSQFDAADEKILTKSKQLNELNNQKQLK